MPEPAVARRPHQAGPAPRRLPWAVPLAVILLALHYALAVGGKFQESTTSDELVHLTAGMSYWRNHDYRLHPENGILPQRWAALPAWLGGAAFPELAGNEYWRKSDAWVVGHQFFYETGEDHFPRLMAGRAMIALFSVATGVLVFCWSRRLFGDAGALVSLGFFVFSTDFLAHGALVTSDACSAFFLLAAAGAWWRHLHDPRARIWWLSATMLGLAFVAKYSAVVLPPMMVVMALVRSRSAEPLWIAGRKFTSSAGKLGAAALSALGHVPIVMLIIWAFFGFRFTAFNPAVPPADSFIRPWPFMEEGIGAAGPVIHQLTAARVLPEGYLYGFAHVLRFMTMRSAFLNGEHSVTGWPTFFIWTFLLKTTLPLLLAGLLVGWLGIRRWAGAASWREDVYRVTPLVTLFAVYWAASLTSHLNIGHRHVLPTYPVIFIGLGALGAWLVSRRFGRVAMVAGLLAWHGAEAARVAPHYLAYFNEIAGGPKNGWRHLIDSSLDWGQDLPGLKRWLEQHRRDEPVFLSYFGTGEPAYYHIPARRLPFSNNFRLPSIYVPLEPGIYCISATMLQHVYSSVSNPEWTLALEKEFQQLRALEPDFARYNASPEQRAEYERNVPAEKWQQAVARFDDLRFARLCHYLRLRGPDDEVGYSILIFRLDAAEVAGATAGSLNDWHALMERAVASKP